MIQVTKNVYIETAFPGCNVGFVITNEGIVMIDTPMRPSDAIKWRSEISHRGELRYLILTEPHPDHYRSIPFFSTVLIAHQETRDILAMVPVGEIMDWVKHSDPEGLPFMEKYQLRLPDITFTDALTLYLGSHTLKLIHLPGHTSSQIGVYIPEERIVFTADNVVYRVKSWLHEAIPHQWLESLKNLSQLDADAIIPGHGDDVCTKKYLEEQARVVEQWVNVVRTAIAQGLSEEEAVTGITCPDPYPLGRLSPISETELNRLIVARLYNILTHQDQIG